VLKLLQALNTLIGGLLMLAVLTALGVGGWIGYQNYYADKLALEQTQAKLADRETRMKALSDDLAAKQKELAHLGDELKVSKQEISRLDKKVEAQATEIERLATIVKLLKLDHRVAQITALSQRQSDDGKEQFTRFSFVEVNESGQPLEKPRVFEIKGDVVYIDAWVVKFDLAFLEQGDPLRSTSICLFRRVFGESQAPADGYALDTVGAHPAAYRSGGKPSEFEQQIWSRFWEYANNRALAKEAGVRAAHGEAPSIKLVPGKRYRIVLQAAGGLRIDPPEEAGADKVQ